MLFSADKNMALCAGIIDIVKGKQSLILCNYEIIDRFFVEDGTKLAKLCFLSHWIMIEFIDIE